MNCSQLVYASVYQSFNLQSVSLSLTSEVSNFKNVQNVFFIYDYGYGCLDPLHFAVFSLPFLAASLCKGKVAAYCYRCFVVCVSRCVCVCVCVCMFVDHSHEPCEND